MKLFWGLYETHEHTFDSTKWKHVEELQRSATDRFSGVKRILGYVSYYQNTCLTCGDLIERETYRGREW